MLSFGESVQYNTNKKLERECVCDILLIYDNIHCVPSYVKSISVISLSFPCSVLLLGQSALKRPSWILLLLSPSTCFVVGLCVVLWQSPLQEEFVFVLCALQEKCHLYIENLLCNRVRWNYIIRFGNYKNESATILQLFCQIAQIRIFCVSTIGILRVDFWSSVHTYRV